MATDLKEIYKKEIALKLKEKLKKKNINEVPKLEKIVINSGLGEAKDDVKIADKVMEEIAAITGQKPVYRRSKKAVSNFKLREDMIIGVSVTLRSKKMWDFFTKLVDVTLPRVRDFKGISRKSFDGKGNLTIGLKEQIIFPEIDYDKIDKLRGMNITIVTTAKTNEEGYELLKMLGMPFAA